MKYTVLYQAICMLYKMMLRDILKKAVDDPNEEWDDVLMAATDALFGFKVE